MSFARSLTLALAFTLAGLAALMPAKPARAEVPVLEPNAPGGDYGLFESAQYVPEPWFMWFVMGELSSPEDVDMAQFDYKAGDRFKAEMFIPAHDELRDFNPTIALIGPGLPPPTVTLPFTLPEGMGAVVATSDGTFDYFDAFTQVTFLPRAKIELAMPETGRYYVAVYGQPIGSARYALDIGVMENFAPHVIARYPINWWEVRGYLQWGHWPAIALAPVLSVAAAWALLRYKRSRRTEQVAGALGFVGLAATVGLLGVQQPVAGQGGSMTQALAIFAVAAIAVGGSVAAGAYVLTPLREKLNLREYAGDDHFAWVDGYAVHYTDDGPPDGPAVVLLHGFAASTFTWRKVKAALLGAGYRVIATDQLGYGASARPAEPVYTTEMQARSVLGVLDALGVQRAHFVGHSFGGRVALQIALLAPERAGALVVLAPEAFAVERPGIARWVRAPFFGYVLAFYSTSPLLVGSGLRLVSKIKTWVTHDAARGYAAPLRVRGSALAQVWQARSPKDGAKPVPANLSAIAHPTLAVWGSDDAIFPAADGERLAAALPNASLHLVPGAGHLVHEECPDAVIEAALGFLSSARAPGAATRATLAS